MQFIYKMLVVYHFQAFAVLQNKFIKLVLKCIQDQKTTVKHNTGEYVYNTQNSYACNVTFWAQPELSSRFYLCNMNTTLQKLL